MMLLNQPEDEVSENKKKNSMKKNNGKVLMVAHEVRIVKRLSSNDENIRSKQLRKLKKWFEMRSKSLKFPLSSEEFLRIWKGLYVCMWMSDKPLVQEDTAEEISSLINCFDDYEIAVKFFCAFYKTMHLEWFGIDQWRINKFLMLARRMVRHVFIVLKHAKWSKDSITTFNSEVFECLSDNHNIGLLVHFLDVYLEELAKVSEGKIPPKAVCSLIKPFVLFICVNKDHRVLEAIRSKIFLQLLWQSERGRDYTEKFNVWKQMGFPTSSIHNLEKIEDEEEELIKSIENEEDNSSNEKALDPRAGNVDVIMPILPVDVQPIIKEINKWLYSEKTSTSSRKFMHTILSKYDSFAGGKFPLGVKNMYKAELEPMSQLIDSKLKSLENLDKELYGTTRELKKINKKSRKRFLSSIDITADVNEDNYEDFLKQKLKAHAKVKSSLNKRPKLELNNQWTEEALTETVQMDTENFQDVGDSLSEQKQNNSFRVEEIVESKLPKRSKELNKCKVKNKKVESPSTLKERKNNSFEKIIKQKKLSPKKSVDSEVLNDPNNLVLNPFAKQQAEKKNKKQNTIILGKTQKKVKSMNTSNFLSTPSKKVKIVLDRNTEQKASEYLRQVKNSPQLPYNPKQQPSKSVLKPNLMPSPINPFFKKKLGQILNMSN